MIFHEGLTKQYYESREVHIIPSSNVYEELSFTSIKLIRSFSKISFLMCFVDEFLQ